MTAKVYLGWDKKILMSIYLLKRFNLYLKLSNKENLQDHMDWLENSTKT